ncbi:hypothetical protein ACOMHN_028863 [Nucella lapillus]
MMTTTDDFSSLTLPPSPFKGNTINSTARVVFAAVGSVMIVCGVMGNACLIAVIFRRFQRKRNVHTLFIANLALADMLTLGYWLTFFVLDLILGYYPVVDQMHCVVNGVMIGILSVVCVLSLVSISLNRYMHVCHSHLYTRAFTLPCTLLVCLLTWVLGTLLALPPALEVGADSYRYNPLTHICSFNREKLTYSKVVVLLFSTLPMAFIGYCNFAIFRFWRRARMSISTRYPIMTPPGGGGKLCTPRRKTMWRGGAGQDQDLDHQESDCAGDAHHPVNPAENTPGVLDSNEGCGFESKAVQSECSAAGCHDYDHMTEREEGVVVNPQRAVKEDAGKWWAAGVETSRCTADPRRLSGSEGGLEQKSAVKNRLTVPECGQASVVNEPSRTTGTSTEGCRRSWWQSPVTDVDNESVTATIPPPPPPTGVTTPALCSTLKKNRSRRQNNNFSKAIQNLQQRRKKQKAREVAFVRSLLVVFVMMIVCFIPYGVSILLSSYITMPDEVTILGIMFLFTNNAVNWIVYGVMNPAFRRGYQDCVQRVLVACCRLKEDRTPRFLKASQSSLTAVSLQRVTIDNDLEQSCLSQADSGAVL